MVRRLYREVEDEWDRKEVLRLCVEYLFLYSVIGPEHQTYIQNSIQGAFSEHPSMPAREDTEQRFIKESFEVGF